MAEDIGIAITMQVKVSATLNSIGNTTKAFRKEIQKLDIGMQSYNRTQSKLSKNIASFGRGLEATNHQVKKAQDVFSDYKKEVAKGALDGAIQEQVDLKHRLDDTETGVKNNQKAFGNLTSQFKKAGGLGGGELGGTAEQGKKLTASGAWNLLSGPVSGAAKTFVGSAVGESGAGLITNVAGGALEGALTFGAAGAVVGMISGLITGVTEIYQKQDEAFKDFVQDEYNSIKERRASELERGSAIAADRESAESGGESDGNTYNAMVDNLGNITDNINASMGDAYNEKNKIGIQADLDAYGGPLGDAMKSMNSMIGEGKGISENLSRQYQREAMSALLLGGGTTVYNPEQAEKLAQMHTDFTNLVDQYNNASSDKDKAIFAAQIEALRGQTEAMADGSYNASDTMQGLTDVEVDLIAAIRGNTNALGQGAWGNNYAIQQETSKGRASSRLQQSDHLTGTILTEDGATVNLNPSAFGLGRVPYNGYPALLHEGERVLTASQARQHDNNPASAQVVLNGPVTVREEADLDKLARKFAAELRRAQLLSTGG